MRSRLWPHRLRILVSLAFCTALALGSFWALKIAYQQTHSPNQNITSSAPDFYVDHFKYMDFLPSGKNKYQVTGTHLHHNPSDDSYQIRNPHIFYLDEKNSPTTAQAKLAIIESENKKIHLYHSVQLEHHSAQTNTPTQLTSDYLLLSPEKNTVQAPNQVTLHVGSSTIAGTGLFANYTTHQVQLLHNVKMRHSSPEPQP